jgi:structural maintenance of chromosome 2
VNKSFSNIFQTLLPGANSMLEKVNENDIQEGLKIKVSFNNDWKDTLSETSGG